MTKAELSLKQIIDSARNLYLDLQDELDSPLRAILLKIFSNLETANILLFEYSKINEFKIIIRSAIESTVLLCYLIKFPNKIEQYWADSELLEFKNHFIAYKSYKEDLKHHSLKATLSKFSEEKIIEENEAFFEKLRDENKEIILNCIKSHEYKLNNKTFPVLKKFFEKYKPFFMKLEDMYNEIDIFSNAIGMQLRELLFKEYNHCSQIAHGSLIAWKLEDKIKPNDLSFMCSLTQRIIFLPLLTCKDNGIVPNNFKMQHLQEEIDKHRKLLGVEEND